jgi:hypothetical protein
VLVGRVVDHQLGDDLHAADVSRIDECAQIGHGAVIRMDPAVISDIIPVVAARRWIKGQQPDCIHAEICNVVDLLQGAAEVADAVTIGVEKRLDVQLVDRRVLVPQRIARRVLAPFAAQVTIPLPDGAAR